MKVSDLDEAMLLRDKRRNWRNLIRAAANSIGVTIRLSQLGETDVAHFIDLKCVRDAIVAEAERELARTRDRLVAIGCEPDDEGDI